MLSAFLHEDAKKYWLVDHSYW